MKRFALPLLLLVLAATAFWLWKRDTGTTLAAPMADFAIEDTSAVSRIFIAESDGKTVDLQRTDGTWTVNGMPANPRSVSLLLKTFRRVEVRSPVARSMEANVLRVMGGTAKKVEIYQGGTQPAKIWYVGHATPDHYGTYMLLEVPGKGKSSAPFILGMTGFTGTLNPRFHAKLDEWRSSTVFAYPDLSRIASVTLEHPTRPGTSFTVVNDTRGVHLRDSLGHPVPDMDSTAVQDLLLQFKDLHFEYFERKLPKVRRDSIVASVPWHVIAVQGTGGALVRIPFWHKPADPGQKDLEFNPMVEDTERMYALLDDTAFVVVQRYVFDRVTVPLKALRK